MAEQESGAFRALIDFSGSCFGFWSEARLQQIPKAALAMELDSSAQASSMGGGQRNASIHGGLIVRGRLGPN
jgi:hypothetical protein